MSGKSVYKADPIANHKYYLNRKKKVAFLKCDVPLDILNDINALAKAKGIPRIRLIIRYLKFGMLNDAIIEKRRHNAYAVKEEKRSVEELVHTTETQRE